MRINGMKNPEAFMKAVDACVGRVELVTGEGDRLNLKSKLAQYVSIEKILLEGKVKELEIVASEPEDMTRLINCLMSED